eukprot:3692318-Rhodomonas_salina.1
MLSDIAPPRNTEPRNDVHQCHNWHNLMPLTGVSRLMQRRATRQAVNGDCGVRTHGRVQHTK